MDLPEQKWRFSVDSRDLQVVRGYVVDKVTLVIDNTEWMYDQIREVAVGVVRDEVASGSGWSRDEFLMMLDGRGPIDRREVADVVGAAVCDRIGEWLNLDDDPLHTMLADLLDLNDRDQAVMFGEHYMPEEGDWPEDEE